MNLLAIDTSFESCTAGLYVSGRILEKTEVSPRGHASLLLPWVETLLAEAGLSLTALDAIAFTRGPGSFTGLRIGISVVQGLAWGSDIGVVPVSSLGATAQSVVSDGVNQALVAMDARMQEVYTARFEVIDGLMRPAGSERVTGADTAAALLEPGDAGVGNGFTRFDELAELKGLESAHFDARPDAASICALALDWLHNNKALAAEQAQPVYVRDNVAKKPG